MPRRRVACVLPLLLAACVPLGPPELGSSLQVTPAFQAANPSNIAVLPIENATARGTIDDLVELIRDEIYEALIRRRYTPLTSSVVDPVVREQAASLADASFTSPAALARVAGRAHEDAALAVRINEWDESRIMSSSRVRFSLAATMVCAKTKEVIWTGTMDGELKAGGVGAAPRYRDDRRLDVARQLAREVIARLPEHDL